jgi:hypothetical protein
VRLAAEIRADQLDGTDAVDEHVACSIDHAHPSFTEPRLESIATRDGFAEIGIL